VRRRHRELLANGVWLLLALGATGLVIATQQSPTSAEQLVRSHHLLTVFRSADVSRVAVEKAGKRYVIGRKPNATAGQADEQEALTLGRWQWLEPFQGDAEETAVDQLLRAVEFATWLRQIPAGDVDRAALGLDTPSVVLSVDMGDAHYRVRVANEVAGGNGARYVEVTGEGTANKGIFVVSEGTVKDLDPDPEDLQIRQLIPYSGAALQKISAKVGEQRVELVRASRQEFRFDGMLGNARVGRDALDRVLLNFSRTEVEHFVPLEQATAAQTAAGSDVLELRLQPRDTSAVAADVFIGGACPTDPKLMLARRTAPRPVAGCIARTDLASAFATPPALVDRALFQAHLDEAERITVVAGERRLELVRQGDTFELRAPAQGAIEKETGDERVTQMLRARGVVDTSGLDLKALGLEPPAATVTIERASAEPNGEREVVDLGQPLPDGARAQTAADVQPSAPRQSRTLQYARRRSDGVVLRIGTPTSKAFSVDASILRARLLWDVANSEVREIEVHGAAFDSVLKQTATGAFTLDVAPSSLPSSGAKPVSSARVEPRTPDAALAVEWIEAVRQLRVERWVAETDDGGFGLEKPTLEFWVTDSAGARHAVRVGRATALGYFAALEGTPGIFVLTRATVTTLQTLILDRSLFMLDKEHFSEFSLARDRQSVTVRRLGSDYEQDPDQAELPPEALAGLTEALSVVRPEAAIALDAAGGDFGFGSSRLEVRFTNGERQPERHWVVGGRGYYRDQAVYYARLSGQPTVYAIAAQQIDALLSQL
jgi:hypothetical protein